MSSRSGSDLNVVVGNSRDWQDMRDILGEEQENVGVFALEEGTEVLNGTRDSLQGKEFRVDNIEAVKELKGGNVSSRGDHRIAMALAVLGLGAKEKITIENSDTVSKSFPSFFELLEDLTK